MIFLLILIAWLCPDLSGTWEASCPRYSYYEGWHAVIRPAKRGYTITWAQGDTKHVAGFLQPGGAPGKWSEFRPVNQHGYDRQASWEWVPGQQILADFEAQWILRRTGAAP